MAVTSWARGRVTDSGRSSLAITGRTVAPDACAQGKEERRMPAPYRHRGGPPRGLTLGCWIAASIDECVELQPFARTRPFAGWLNVVGWPPMIEVWWYLKLRE